MAKETQLALFSLNHHHENEHGYNRGANPGGKPIVRRFCYTAIHSSLTSTILYSSSYRRYEAIATAVVAAKSTHLETKTGLLLYAVASPTSVFPSFRERTPLQAHRQRHRHCSNLLQRGPTPPPTPLPIHLFFTQC